MIIERIIVDLDSTLSRMHEDWIAAYNAHWSDTLTTADMTCWDVHTIVKPECGRAVYQYLTSDLLRRTAVQPDAIEGMHYLQDRFDVLIASASTPRMVIPKTHWLQKHFAFIQPDQYCWLYQKWLLHGDMMIDDRFSNIDQFLDVHPRAYGLLFAQPWNDQEYASYLSRVTPGQERILRVESWRDILNFFQQDHRWAHTLDARFV